MYTYTYIYILCPYIYIREHAHTHTYQEAGKTKTEGGRERKQEVFFLESDESYPDVQVPPPPHNF